jgi:hypothetical protein
VFCWLKENYGQRASSKSPLSSIANENQRIELEYMREKVPQLEREFAEGSSQNIPEVKIYFEKFDTPIKVNLT